MSRHRQGRGRDRRWLHVEGLERRELLAGNLQVSVAGSKLFITGDNLANNAAVVALTGGRYAVAGLGTTINGGNNIYVTPRSVSHISANLNGGDDALGLSNNAQAIFDLANNAFGVDLQTILGVSPAVLQALIAANTTVTEFSLSGSLTVAAGSGDDVIGVVGNIGGPVVVSLGSADVGGGNAFGIDGSSLTGGNGVIGAGISIVGDSQNDAVAIVSTDVRHSISIALGGGANSFLLDDSNVGGGVAYVGGEGVDNVEIFDAAIAVNVSLALGNGATNSVDIERVSTGAVAITTGSGADDVFAERVTVRHGVTIWTGGGADDVTIQGDTVARSSIGGSLTIDTGSGDDDVFLSANIAHSLAVVLGDGADTFGSDMLNIGFNATIDAGRGNDTLRIDDTVVGYFFYAFLGSGDDTVNVTTSDARGAYLFGGLGTDRLTVDAATLAAVDNFFRTEFEL